MGKCLTAPNCACRRCGRSPSLVYAERLSQCGQGRRHGFESGGGNFASGASQKKFFDPPTFWPVGGQNIA